MLVPHSRKSVLEESLDFSPIEQEAGINPINTILPDYDTLPTLFAPTFLSLFSPVTAPCCKSFFTLFLHLNVSLNCFFIGMWAIWKRTGNEF